ncbi:MAG: helix-turn-helix domain-containing protein [Clostridia bacterium]|nr:helix-turn-helix domain-containing protein [Clostridia bacterium]
MENYSFGMKLSELRKQNGMTQLDLADKLGVTDKAVSKWERDLAYPEVENLIKISELFGVSLDLLLKGESPSVETSDVFKREADAVSKESSDSLRKIIGTVLICFGSLTFLVLLLWGGLLSALLFSSPFFLCGIVCLVFKKRLGLFCSWAVFLAVCLYLGYATGVSLGSGLILRTIASITFEDRLTVSTIISWCIWLIYLSLVIWTAFSFRWEKFSGKKFLLMIVISAVAFVFLTLFSIIWSRIFTEYALLSSGARFLNRTFISFIGILKHLSVVVLVTALFNKYSNRHRNVK